jgi:membrane protein DedA with SNARE-associated domain
MADLLLDWMTVYGVSVLVLALLAQPLGLPIPTGLLVLATGAFARQGLVDWRGMAAVSLAASVAGDCASYALRRVCGPGRGATWAPAAPCGWVPEERPRCRAVGPSP